MYHETFIIVVHDPGFVRKACDRCALMRMGKIVMTGRKNPVPDESTEQEQTIMANE